MEKVNIRISTKYKYNNRARILALLGLNYVAFIFIKLIRFFKFLIVYGIQLFSFNFPLNMNIIDSLLKLIHWANATIYFNNYI